MYGQDELDTLQQILFYRELGFPLEEIKSILYSPGYDRGLAFQSHLTELNKKRERLDALINNVKKSISAMKGEITMTDNEKFVVFKQTLIDENEQKYGVEIRSKYGNVAVDASNAKLKGMTQEQYDESIRLSQAYENALKSAFEAGNPAGELAQSACDLHRQWLCLFYPDYSKEYHISLGEMYVADERFKAYYEDISPGCAEFFCDAINVYCK
jgi:DNA-binding transcriptional MerR regulator